MSIVYGLNTVPTNDPFVEFAQNGMKAVTKAANPKTAALVGIFPFHGSRCRRSDLLITVVILVLKLPMWISGRFFQGRNGRGKCISTLTGFVKFFAVWHRRDSMVRIASTVFQLDSFLRHLERIHLQWSAMLSGETKETTSLRMITRSFSPPTSCSRLNVDPRAFELHLAFALPLTGKPAT